MNYIKLYENFENTLSLEELIKKYPEAKITFEPAKFKNSYFARVDIKKQDGKYEYLGALKGPVSKESAIKFFNDVLNKNYDKFY
jgi:hypothetical protein